MPVIEVNHLTRDFGGERGIFDISLSVSKGEVFGFLGPNGAGKTTTIRHLMGFMKCRQGSCRIHGQDCFNQASLIQRDVGYIPGEIAFMDEMDGRAFLTFIHSYRGMTDEGRTRELLERFELNPEGKIKRMSKGMKQKIGIVCAFMHDPQLLILDEPTSGLDPLMQNRFIELLTEEKKRGKTIFLSSHMFEEVERTCDRVGMIRDGRMAALDDVATIKASRRKRFRVVFEDEASARRFAALDETSRKQEKNRVTVTVRGSLKDLLNELGTYPVTDLDSTGQSLEEAFMHYYGGGAR